MRAGRGSPEPPEPAIKEEPARIATAITGAASVVILILQQTGLADITIGEAVAYLFTLYATLNERTREKVTAAPKG